MVPSRPNGDRKACKTKGIQVLQEQATRKFVETNTRRMQYWARYAKSLVTIQSLILRCKVHSTLGPTAS